MSSSTCASTSTAGIQETLVSSSQEVTIQEEQETLNLNDTSQIDEPVQKKLKSSVWQNFQRISRLKASCLICQKEIIISQGSTSALQRHYDRKHGSSDATQVNKTPRVQVQPLPNDSTRSKLITNAIAFMMSRDLQPSSIVEDDGFKNLIQTLEPRYELPARTTFSRNVLPKIAKEQEVFLRTKLELGLRDLRTLSFTMDGWTSRATDGYMSLTMHYLDKNFCLQNICFGDATRFMCGEQYSTIGRIIPVITALKDQLIKGFELAAGMQKLATLKLRNSVDNRLKVYWDNDLLWIAMTLNPQFKNKLFDEENDLTPMEIMMRSRIRLAEMDGRKDEIEFNNEFQRYLDELCIGMRENILTWWSNNKNKYSKLSEIALDTLGIVSTSASSERCFSHAGAIVSERRSRLLTENVEMLSFLHKNWRM
ncbi:hypothetical protein TKK_0019126 [Trichogramma kaykai]